MHEICSDRVDLKDFCDYLEYLRVGRAEFVFGVTGRQIICGSRSHLCCV